MHFILSPVFALISFIVGVLGFAFAVFTYFRTKKDLRWKYSVNSFNLIGGQHPLSEEFQVLYKREAISSVTVSKVLLVNSGDVPIAADQIATREPMALHIANGKILDCSLSAQSNEASAFRLKQFDHRVTLHFSHLNAGDGAVFRVLHTGGTSTDLQMRGELIGFGPPKRVDPFSYDNPAGRRNALIALSVVTIIALFLTVPGCTPLRSLIPAAFVPMITALAFLVPLWLLMIFRFFSPILPVPLRDFHGLEE